MSLGQAPVDLYAHDAVDSAWYHGECDSAKVRCYLWAIRADYEEDTEYLTHDTEDLMATRLEIRLNGNNACSKEELSSIKRISDGSGIRLLSPDSVVPARPLLNGFCATSFDKSLDLLKYIGLEAIQVIDVRDRSLEAFYPRLIKYVSLSYVWGDARDAHLNLFDELQTMEEADGRSSTTLPPRVPGIIEEVMMVCRRISIPYLWVDPSCIHQADPETKAREIESMSYIYYLSHITIVAGSAHPNGTQLIPVSSSAQEKHQSAPKQRAETIGSKQYITSLPSITSQIHASAWPGRDWTYQEGQRAKRLAFVGDHDVSFLCGAGHWRESLHSGKFGHDANLPGVEMHSKRYHFMSSSTWLRQTR
ncbi:hypothetical protein PG990_000852 [Apiospora arundinis]